MCHIVIHVCKIIMATQDHSAKMGTSIIIIREVIYTSCYINKGSSQHYTTETNDIQYRNVQKKLRDVQQRAKGTSFLQVVASFR